MAIPYLPANMIPTRSYLVCVVAANYPTIYIELQNREAEQRSLTREIDELYEYDFSPPTNEGSKFSCNMRHQDIYCLQVFTKIYENPMRFTDFRRNYCAPGNLSCKVWYLFPVVICCPFFSSHHALFMVVLVGEPNSTDTLHQREGKIQIENPPRERMNCLRDPVQTEFTFLTFSFKLNFCNLPPAQKREGKQSQ